MAEQKRRRGKRRDGYTHRSPAIHVTVYDMHGKPMPDPVATEILFAVTQIAKQHNYLINFAQT